MFDQKNLFDQIGPQRIVHIYDPSVGLKGILVVDTAIYGRFGGGIRMVPDLTVDELSGLARAMTCKFAILDIPRGGAKLGIVSDYTIKGVKRKKILEAFGQALRPFLLSGLGTGADIGIFENDLDVIFNGAGIKRPGVGLSKKKVNGDSLEYYTTSYGVFNAALAACHTKKINLSGARVAIEGFGKVGTGVAFFMREAGARIVAVSTKQGALYNEKGLDIDRLIRLRRRCGDELVREYKEATRIPANKIYFLPVDILVPGARPYVISKTNVNKVKAKVISSAANIPLTDEAEKILFEKGVAVVPDFISNAGGTIFAMLDRLGVQAKDVFPAIAGILGPLSKNILTSAQRQRQSPRNLALKKIHIKLRKAAREKKAYSDEMFKRLLYERFSL